jgi:hypothetical protein
MAGMIVDLLNKVDEIANGFVINGYQNLANHYAPDIYALAILSLIVFGYAVATGWISLSLAEVTKRILLIGMVLEFALNWGTFSKYVYDLFTQAPNDLSDTLINAIPHTAIIAKGVNGALQQAFFDGVGYGVAIMDQATALHWSPFFCGSAIILLVNLLTGIALIEIIGAKLGLSIFLVLAPVVIPTLLFKALKEMLFDGWVKHLITCAFIPIFVTTALALSLSLLANSSIEIGTSIKADSIDMSHMMAYIISIIVCIGLVIKAIHMATSIAGGFAMGLTPYIANKMNSFNRSRSIKSNYQPAVKPTPSPVKTENSPKNP